MAINGARGVDFDEPTEAFMRASYEQPLLQLSCATVDETTTAYEALCGIVASRVPENVEHHGQRTQAVTVMPGRAWRLSITPGVGDSGVRTESIRSSSQQVRLIHPVSDPKRVQSAIEQTLFGCNEQASVGEPVTITRYDGIREALDTLVFLERNGRPEAGRVLEVARFTLKNIWE